MRKKIRLLIALFTLGQAAMAQSLNSGEQLKQKESFPKMPPKTALVKADAAATPYWVDAKSYYDANRSYSREDGCLDSYRADLTFNGDKVTITNLVNLGEFQVTSTSPIEGTYDSAAKTITINTPGYDSERAVADYAHYGDCTYFGNDCSIVLFAGDFSTEPDKNGQYGLETTDKLVFDVSDDLSTITPRTGFGLWVLVKKNATPYGAIRFYQGGTVGIEKMPDEAKLTFIPSNVHFEGPNVTVGSILKQSVRLVNKGLKSTNYTGLVDGKGLRLLAYQSIDAGTVQNVYVEFSPSKTGAYSGTVQVKNSHGEKAVLNVTATVGEAPDYSKIVKEGDIAFSMGTDFPFVITDTITGYPVAVATNKGNNTTATLFANLVVPEGKVGLVSWKGFKKGSYGNGFTIQNNDDQVFNDVTSHGMDGGEFTDNVENALALKPGTYVLQFQNITNNDWAKDADVRYRAYIYDMVFRLYDQQEHLAVLKQDALDFGNHFFDQFSVRDTLTVQLINLGTESLSLTSIDGDGSFSGVMSGATAAFSEELPVQIAFDSKELGEQSGLVVLHTNTGSYRLTCKASNTAIPVDYHPIVTNGDFSFNTSAEWPFTVEGNKTFNSTAKKSSDGSENLNSFLEASFEVPENKIGVLSWTGHNSSKDFFEFMGSKTLTTGTRITLDGSISIEFAGPDVDASSTQFAPKDLKFGPGRHTVRFFYLKKDLKPNYDDRVDISSLSVTYTDAVKGVQKANGEVVRTEYYTLNGQRVAEPQQGLYLVKTIFADGTSHTVKVLR